jgi:nucleoside-diphosphate-sugar epimerase
LYGPPTDPPDVDLFMDVRDVQMRELSGAHAVIHLAALSNDDTGSVDPALTRAVNSAATFRLAQLAERARVCRFIFVSSCSVYGAQVGVLDESSPMRPLTPYSRAKAEAEMGLLTHRSGLMSTVVLRCGTLFGFSPALRVDLSVNRMVCDALRDGVVHVRGGTSSWRPFVAVDDVARTIVATLNEPRRSQTLLRNVVGVGQNRRILDVARAVASQCGADVVIDASTPPDCLSYRARTAAADGPIVRCGTTVEDGIEDLVARLGPVPPDPDLMSRLAQLRAAIASGDIGPDLRPAVPALTRNDDSAAPTVAAPELR